MYRGVTFEKVFSDIFFFLWLVILWGVIIYRLVSTGGSSDLLNYYTNWSWILQAVFFLIDYIGRIVEWARDAAGVYIRFYNALGLFWLINGSIWLVIVLVTIIIEENPSLLTNAANDEGGPGDLGLITDAHILIHYVPGYVILVFMILERRLVGDSIFQSMKYAYMGYSLIGRAIGLLLGFFIVIVSPAIMFIIYALIFHPQAVYGFYTSMTTFVLIALVVIVFTNFLPYMLFFEHYVVLPLYDVKHHF